jgi:hypothetical protein
MIERLFAGLGEDHTGKVKRAVMIPPELVIRDST